MAALPVVFALSRCTAVAGSNLDVLNVVRDFPKLVRTREGGRGEAGSNHSRWNHEGFCS